MIWTLTLSVAGGRGGGGTEEDLLSKLLRRRYLNLEMVPSNKYLMFPVKIIFEFAIFFK